MVKKRAFFLILSLAVLFPALCFADLTGTWECDDGGKYYLRQVGNTLYWYGERSEHNPAWTNVFEGRIMGDRIRGDWADVPKGRTGSRGVLSLVIRHHGNVLEAERKTGGFGGSKWKKEGYHEPAPAPSPPPSADLSEDCIGFNPDNARMRRIDGRYKIVDGSHWLFDFGNKRGEARQALRIIKHYRMNQSCFVGRPHPSFTYMLVSGRAPRGAMGGEDCVSFNPATAEVRNMGGRWKIVDGNHLMFDFGNKEQEARTALKIIKKYRFTKSCFVGRPHASFKYLRR